MEAGTKKTKQRGFGTCAGCTYMCHSRVYQRSINMHHTQHQQYDYVVSIYDHVYIADMQLQSAACADY